MRFLKREISNNDFRRNFWRLKPTVIAQALSSKAFCPDGIDQFPRWCVAPSSARVFVRSERSGSGTAKAWKIPSPEEAMEVYSGLRREGQIVTLLLNGIDRVDPSILQLRSEFGVGLDWRYDDVVATLSMVGSGIGYHAGHEDGFIVQVCGKRNWKVWPPEVLPRDYRNSLLNDPEAKNAPTPTRPSSTPCLECELSEGDVLYIPALHGHEGTTLSTSMSLSIAWKGVTYAQILRDLGVLPTVGSNELENSEIQLYSLFPDPPFGAEPFEWIRHKVNPLANKLGVVADSESIKSWLFRQLRCSVSVTHGL